MVTNVFDQKLLQELIEPARTFTKSMEAVRHIFTAIDPACGGTRSKWAAVTAVYPQTGDMVVSDFFLFFLFFSFAATPSASPPFLFDVG